MILDPSERVKTTIDEDKKTVYTVTRAYIAPDGTKQVKTTEYYGPKADQVSFPHFLMAHFECRRFFD